MLYHNAVQHKEIFKFCGFYGDRQFCPLSSFELRGDVEAFRFGKVVTGNLSCSAIRLNGGSGCQLKFQPTYFLPRRFHLTSYFFHQPSDIGCFMS